MLIFILMGSIVGISTLFVAMTLIHKGHNVKDPQS